MVSNKMYKKKQLNNRPKTRKQLRKDQRKMKKQRRAEYYTNRPKPGRFVLKPSEDVVAEKTLENDHKSFQKPEKKKLKNTPNKRTNSNFNEIENEKRKQKKLEKEMQKQRKKQLFEANLQEDRNIKQLEKQLKLNKRKSKLIPKTFASEGLDYILEVCDSENIKGIVNAEQELNDSGNEFDEDFALMANQPRENLKEASKYPSADSDDENNNDSEMMSADEENFNDDNENSISNNEEQLNSEDDMLDHSIESSEDSDNSGNKSRIKRKAKGKLPIKKKQKTELDGYSNSGSDVAEGDVNDNDNDESETWEDIYGRIRSTDGSIISDNSGKYIPPAIRAKMDGKVTENKERMEKLARLKKQIKGMSYYSIHNCL
ncbi:hypothetical protein AMK59_6348 [Oryctes borbonicus]|uniref:Uncharacterized protein n=1 Tax=Oryctes borbonicus TaxID=1629725 RepID=A0A0T6B1U7_9SCAR|nr:hypothetical protein AMK59_6348 [Oryctes borbonicus]